MTRLPAPAPVQPGAFGLVRAHTWGQRAVAAAEGLAGVGSPYVHAFLVLDHNQQIGALPTGAKIDSLQPYLDRAAADPDSVVFCDGPIRRHLAAHGGGDPDGQLEEALRGAVDAAGRSFEATPYSFLDYAWLAALHSLGVGAPAWLRRAVETTKHVICSQLVDVSYALAGIQLYDDERFAGSVTPGDLGQYREDWLAELAARVAA